MKKLNFFRVIIALALMLTGTLPTLAHAFEVDGIYYNFTSKTDKTVAVTYNGTSYNKVSNEYTGVVTIPSYVSYLGTTYSVTSIGYSAFWDCSGLTSVTIPNSVTEIGDYAFSNCDSLTSVTIPNSVTKIGSDAFSHCAGLTEVTIGNSVTSIGEKAFNYCSRLTSVTIGNSVTSIGHRVFSCCYNLRSVIIPNSVTEIDYYAFSHCYNLRSVTIGNSVASIGDMAFYDCPNLKFVINLSNLTFSKGNTGYGFIAFNAYQVINVPNDGYIDGDFVWAEKDNVNTLVTYLGNATELILPMDLNGENYNIGNYAFCECYGLKNVTIGNSVTEIGNYAFCNCDSLTDVTIGNSVTEIGNYAFCCGSLTEVNYNAENCTSMESTAFDGCTRLYTINIGNSVKTIPSNAFYGCYQLTEVNISDLSAWCKIDFDSSNANPLYYAGHLKLNGTEITNLVIPNDITKIKAYAFYGCTGLTSVTIPNSVTSIGESAFCNCDSLTDVTIGNSVTDIGDYALLYCTDLATVNYNAENCTSMGSSSKPVFYGCTNLKTINIGNSVKTIPSYAFSGCTGLTEVNISDLSAWCKIDFGGYDANPLYYAGHLKLNGTEITNLVIPNNITEIKGYAFSGCTGLTSVTIPNSVTSIGYDAFYGCYQLTEVNISDLSAWCKIDFDSSNANPLYYAGHLKLNGTEITNLVIPDDIYQIKRYTFVNCTGLTSVTIPNSVTSIGTGAFSGSGLRLIFSYCMTPPTCEDEAFYGCYDARLMVPEGTYYDYLVANEWYKFDKIQEIAGIEGVEVDNNAVEVARYDIYGRQLTEPTKGINIIKMSDGSTRKEYVK